jgi:hypothetical protein
LEKEFPQFFECIKKLKSIPLKVNGKNNGDNFPPHLLIFKEESFYAREVLKRCCLGEGFPVLPLHDSFITCAKDYSGLERVICGVSTDFYDYVLAHKRKF